MRLERGALMLAVASCASAGGPASPRVAPTTAGPADGPHDPTEASPPLEAWMQGPAHGPREHGGDGCVSRQSTMDPPFLARVSCTAPLSSDCKLPSREDSDVKIEVGCDEDRTRLPKEVDCKPLLRPLPETPGGARTADYVGADLPQVELVYTRPSGLALEHFGGHNGAVFRLGPHWDGSCDDAPWIRLGKPGPPGAPPVRGFLCTRADDSQELFVESDDCHGVVVSRSPFIKGKPPTWVVVARVKTDPRPP